MINHINITVNDHISYFFFKFSTALIQTEVKLLSNKNKILLCIAGTHIRTIYIQFI